jgi:hypothetical protein
MGPLIFGSIFLKEGLKLIATTWMTHFSQGFSFNLTYTLTGNIKLFTYFFEGMVCAHLNTKAHT